MSGFKKTPNGETYYYAEPDVWLANPAFVVLHETGEYSGLWYSAVYVADSVEGAEAWMDAHPLAHTYTEGYELQVCERAVQPPRSDET